MQLHIDNAAAKAMAEATASSSRTRHISVRFHYIRDLVTSGKLQIIYVPTTRQLADVLTKPLAAPFFAPAASRLLGSIAAVPANTVGTI